MMSVPQYLPYPNPSATVTSTFTFPAPEPEIGYDDKKSAKENLARAVFEMAKQIRLVREQLPQLGPALWPQPAYPQPDAYPWWQYRHHGYPMYPDPWCPPYPDITCAAVIRS